MRIMTTNIWGDYFGNPCGVREKDMYEVYKTYTPDVIGMQEVTKGWYGSNLLKWLSDDYYFVGTELFESINYVPLVIKKCYTLVASGYERLDDTLDVSKAITWAVVFDKNNDKHIAFCNTHFWYKTGDPAHDALRAKNALQLTNLMKYLRDRYNCPVFAFGDMNCIRQSQAFGVVYCLGGVRHLYDLTEDRDNICTIRNYPTADEKGCYHGTLSEYDYSRSIDHIVALGDGYSVKQYRVVTDQYALDATDHCPVYADVFFE